MSGTQISSTTAAGTFTEAQHGKQRQRREHRIEELRQVRAEIGLQLVDALNRDLHDLGGLDLLIIRRA